MDAKVKSGFSELSASFSKQIKTRNEYRRQVLSIKKLSHIYTAQALQEKIDEGFPAYVQQTRDNYSAAENAIQKIKQAVINRERAWDNVGSLKLANTLKVIELCGGSLNELSIQAIRDNFAGDLISLNILKNLLVSKVNDSQDALGSTETYLAHAAIDTFNELLYNPLTAYDDLLALTRETFYRAMGMTKLINQAGKLARLEGLELAVENDPDSIQEEVDQAFGLMVFKIPEHPDLFNLPEVVNEIFTPAGYKKRKSSELSELSDIDRAFQ